MKKLAVILSLLLLSIGTWGQNAVEALAAKASASATSFDYSYTIKMQFSMKGNGHVTVQGDAFRMEGNGLVMCCDGRTRWTADEEAEELVIEDVQAATDFLANPAKLIGTLDSTFDMSDDGNGCFTLIPKSRDGIKQLQLKFKGEKLVSAVMTLKDGTVAEFAISNMKFSSLLPSSAFQYDSVDNSWVITDLR